MLSLPMCRWPVTASRVPSGDQSIPVQSPPTMSSEASPVEMSTTTTRSASTWGRSSTTAILAPSGDHANPRRSRPVRNCDTSSSRRTASSHRPSTSNRYPRADPSGDHLGKTALTSPNSGWGSSPRICAKGWNPSPSTIGVTAMAPAGGEVTGVRSPEGSVRETSAPAIATTTTATTRASIRLARRRRRTVRSSASRAVPASKGSGSTAL
jgi:hypothetical protein